MTHSKTHVARTIFLSTSCLFTAALFASASARAGGLPTGGNVTNGNATITTGANSTTINQTSNKAIITWTDFSIAAGNSVTFNQPNQNAIALNRVLGSTPSVINGDIFANGHVWLINGNGVLFGKNAQVNVGSLIATTADIADQDFMKGDYKFGTASANPNAAIVNNGVIRANNGSVVLAGPVVSNNGIIQADLGNVTLGGVSTFAVDFTGDNLLRFQVGAPVQQTPVDANGNPVKALVSNTGTISAKGGRVMMTTRAAESVVDNVINNTGMVEATSVSSHNGEIVLDAGDGTVDNSGTLDASGKDAGQTGGTITVAAKNITVADGSKLDASGDQGGGTIRIGGDAHGQGTMAHAQNTTIGKATIKADAITNGNGGTVVVWSDGQTRVAGTISARGGQHGGNGGFVETSGHHLAVTQDASVNTLAPNGATGNWLLDPDYIVIQSGGETSIGSNGTVGLDDDPEQTDFIDPATIAAALASTDVTLEATHDISVVSDLIYSSKNDLSLLAEGNVYVSANIENTRSTNGGSIHVIGGWDGVTMPNNDLTATGVYGNGGSVYIGGEGAGQSSVGSASGNVLVAGEDVRVIAQNANAQIGFAGTGGGDINVLASHYVYVDADTGTNAFTAAIGNGSSDATSTTGNIDVYAGYGIRLGTFGDGSRAVIGHISNASSVSGDITIDTNGELYMYSANYATGSLALIGDLVNVQGDVLGHTEGGIDITAGNILLNSFGEGATAQIGHRVNEASVTGDLDIYSGDIHLEAKGQNSFARIGNRALSTTYDSYLHGDLNVVSTGRISISADGSYSNARIEEGSDAVVGDVNISAVGNLELDAGGYHALAWIGAQATTITGDTTVSSQYGINLLVNGSSARASIEDNGTLDGNLTVDAQDGSVHLSVYGDNASAAFIGVNGTGGTVTVDADHGSVVLYAHGIAADTAIGHSGGGSYDPDAPVVVSGDVVINAAYAVVLNAYGANSHASIGNQSGGVAFILDPTTGQQVATELYGNTYGDITINAGQQLDLSITGDHAVGRVGGTGTNVNGDITINTGTGSTTVDANGAYSIAAIGGQGYDSVTGDIAITASDTGYGSITVHAGGDHSFAQIGHDGSDTFDTTTPIALSGDITLSTRETTTVASAGAKSTAQIGHHGAGSGDILVHSDTLAMTSAGGTSQIGNGSMDPGVNGTVSGNIEVRIADQTFLDSGETSGNLLIGNALGTATTGISGNVIITTGNIAQNTPGDEIGDMLFRDVAFGDVTYGVSGDNISINTDRIYNSSHNLTLLSHGNLIIGAMVQNDGSGNMIALGGWDGTTVDAAHVLDAGVFGNGGGVGIGADSGNNSAFGSKHGTTTVAGGSIQFYNPGAFAQIGYHGAGTGDINVIATQDLTLYGGNTAAHYALIGNGSLSPTYGGNVGGNISVNVGGLTTFAYGGNTSEGGLAWLGNSSALGNATGNVTFVTGQVTSYGSNSDGIDPNTLKTIIAKDLGTSDTTGGDFTFALTNPNTDFLDSSFGAGPLNYTSPHDLTILSVNSLTISSSIQNSGTGDLTILAGWDKTIAPANVLTTPNAYGLNGADVWVVGNTGLLHDYNVNSTGSYSVDSGAGAAVGTKGGVTTVGAAQIYVEGLSGYAQIGYHGDGGSGDINVIANGTPGTNGYTGISACFDANANVCVIGGRQNSTGSNPAYAQIGNLGMGVTGTSTSNINVSATGNIAISGGGIYADGGDAHLANTYGMIGSGDASATTTQNVSGNITVTAGGSLNFASSDAVGSLAWLGNRTGTSGTHTGNVSVFADSLADGTVGGSLLGNMFAEDLGTTGDSNGGDVLIALDGTDALYIGGSALLANSSHTFSLLNGGDIDIVTSLQNAGTGAVNIVAGWDGTTTDSAHFGDRGVYGNNEGSVTVGGANASVDSRVGSAAGLTTVLGNNVTVSAQNANAQIGYNGAGTGNIVVTALNDVTVTSALAGSTALIGNGGTAVTGNILGDVTVTAGGDIDVTSGTTGSLSIIGNFGGDATEQGDIVLDAGGALTVTAGTNGRSIVGNWSQGGSAAGAATGNIDITSNSLELNADGDNTRVQIGNGRANASVAGDITIHTGNVLMNADGSGSVARIGHNPAGNNLATTSGDIYLEAAGNIVMQTTGDAGEAAANAIIGSGAGSTITGNVTVLTTHGGLLSMIAGSANSQVRIGDSALDSVNGDTSVTADGDIYAIAAGANSAVLIGAQAANTITGDTHVRSVNSTVIIGASGDGALGRIGSNAYDSIDGDITVDALGGVEVLSAGVGSNALIGSSIVPPIDTSTPPGVGTISGDITVNGGSSVTLYTLNDSAVAQIGHGLGSDGETALTGNIAVNADAISLLSIGQNSITRLGNNFTALGSTIHGDLTVTANDGLSLMSGFSDGQTTTATAIVGSNAAGNITGDLLVNTSEGGTVSLISGGPSAITRIGSTSNATIAGDTTVTADSDVTLTASGTNSSATIGAQAATVNGDTTVQSTNGGVTLSSEASKALTRIGAVAYTGITGDTTVSTEGEGGIELAALGANSNAIIGGTILATPGSQPGSISGGVTVTTPGALTLTADAKNAKAEIGHTGPSNGAINVTAHDLTLNAQHGANSMAQIGSSSTTGVTGTIGGDILVHIAGSTLLNGNVGKAWLGHIVTGTNTASGNTTLITGDFDDNSANDLRDFLVSDLTYGNTTLGVTAATGPVGPDEALTYESSHTFNLLSTGDVVFGASLQNTGTGAINIVAGWDGETLDPSQFGNTNVFGNGSHGVTIGLGEGVDSTGAAVGSQGGQTNVYGSFLTLAATNGYAQLGYHGAGAGSINVHVLGDVDLNGGSSTGDYAQIGNGGRQVSGSNSGTILISAGGDVVLTGGEGNEAYAQIGHGGAESNTSSQGYSDTGLVTVNATNVTLTSGTGPASYTQIGHGGYKAGANLTGSSEIGGNIAITVAHNVSIHGGGTDAYSQIGHGGNQMNTNAASSAHGNISGNITVTAPNGDQGSVTMTAGSGDHAYVQIGNGGYSINAPTQAVADNFTIGGDVTITDLALTGGSGSYTFAQIGNGDQGKVGVGNVTGNILLLLNGGTVSLTNGTGPHSNAGIHNATGKGSVNGTVSGYQGGNEGGDGNVITAPETSGTIVDLTKNPQPIPPTPSRLPDIVLVTEPPLPEPKSTGTNPIEEMSGGDSDEQPSDKAAETLGDSLSGGKKPTGTILLGGILKQQNTGGQSTKPHPVPSADENYSSWGNEALWQ